MASLAELQSALVTGASSGIGLAVARALRERGLVVAMVARSRARLEQAAQELGGIAFAADVADPMQLKTLAEDVGKRLGDAPGVLVNAAGAFGIEPISQSDIGSFDAMVNTNLRAPYVLMRSFLPRMIERGSGHIVSIGSVAGRQAFPGNGGYSASKFGLRGLHAVLEQELRGTGVRATLVEPAATDTPLWDSIDRAQSPGLPERAAMLSSEAVAAAVLFALEQPAGVAVKYLGIERS